MNTQLKGVKIQRAITGDNDFAIEDTTEGQCGLQRCDEFRKVPVQRLFVPALDQNLVVVPEYQGAETIPFRFENPLAFGRQLTNPFGKHRQDRWSYRKIHGPPDRSVTQRIPFLYPSGGR